MDNKAVWLSCLHEVMINQEHEHLSLDVVILHTNILYIECLKQVQGVS